MISEAVLIAIIGAIGSIGGSALLINWRLKELEKKVDSHNGYAQKFADYTTNLAVMANDIKYIKDRLDKVEYNEKQD